MIVWMGPKKFRVVSRARSRDVAAGQGVLDRRKTADRLLPGRPFGLAAEQVLLGDHLQHRTDVLGHAAVDQHEAVADHLPGLRRDLAVRIDMVVGQAGGRRLMPYSGSSGLGRAAFDHLHARPDAAGILPAAAGTAQPFAEDRPGGDQLAVPARSSVPVSDWIWPVARMQHGDDGRQQVRGDGQAGTLGDVVHLADDFQPQPRVRPVGPARRPASGRSLPGPGG